MYDGMTGVKSKAHSLGNDLRGSNNKKKSRAHDANSYFLPEETQARPEGRM